MPLLTDAQTLQLLANGSPDNRGKDHRPVVKLHLPDSQAVWLLTEIDPDDTDTVYGLYDPGLGFPVLQHMSLDKIASGIGQLGMAVERDRAFIAHYPLSVYVRTSRILGFIAEEQRILALAVPDAVPDNAPSPRLIPLRPGGGLHPSA